MRRGVCRQQFSSALSPQKHTVLLHILPAGNCGKGPNMVLMPGEVRLRHVSTPADMLGVLKSLSIDIEPATLQATEVGRGGWVGGGQAACRRCGAIMASTHGLSLPGAGSALQHGARIKRSSVCGCSTTCCLVCCLPATRVGVTPCSAGTSCLQLRLEGNALAGGGDLQGAISKYQQVSLRPAPAPAGAAVSRGGGERGREKETEQLHVGLTDC